MLTFLSSFVRSMYMVYCREQSFLFLLEHTCSLQETTLTVLAMASRKESHLFLTLTAWNKVIIEKQNRAKVFFSLLKVKKQVFMFVSFSINNIVI